jgi:Cu/Ag efflux protein CusF
MKFLAFLILALAALAPVTLRAAAEKTADKNCGCACCKGKAVCCCNTEAAAPASPTAANPSAPAAANPSAPAAAPEIKRYALRGVVVAVDADKSALRVKHEEIPGFMRAMTMQFKVDAPTLAAAKIGATLTGQMSRQGKDWVLEAVKFLP